MSIAYDLFLRVAQAMREAGQTITEPVRLSGSFEAKQKNDQTLVTIADGKAEAFLSERLTAYWPDAKILGEESFEHARWQDSPLLNDPGRVFVIDPIDGTVRFARGDDYGVMVAHKQNNKVCAAWIYYPVADDMLFASQEDRTHHIVWDKQGNPVAQPLPPIPAVPVADVVLNTYSTRFPPGEFGPFGELARQFKTVRRNECGATEVRDMLFKGTSAQLNDNQMTPWDRLPIAYLAERAGAPDVVDFQGRPVSGHNESSVLITPSVQVRDAILTVTQAVLGRSAVNGTKR